MAKNHAHSCIICIYIDGHLGWFCLLAIANSAVGVSVSLWVECLCGTLTWSLLGVDPRSTVAGSHDGSVFRFLRNRRTDSQ